MIEIEYDVEEKPSYQNLYNFLYEKGKEGWNLAAIHGVDFIFTRPKSYKKDNDDNYGM